MSKKLIAPIMTIEAPISIGIKTGEFLTVWLVDKDNKYIQVELQVDHDGNPHVFLKKENMKFVAEFDEYYGN